MRCRRALIARGQRGVAKRRTLTTPATIVKVSNANATRPLPRITYHTSFDWVRVVSITGQDPPDVAWVVVELLVVGVVVGDWSVVLPEEAAAGLVAEVAAVVEEVAAAGLL